MRWEVRTHEVSNYPGIDLDYLYDEYECDPPEERDLNKVYPCNPAIHPVWIYDLDNTENGWQPLDAPEGLGTLRDITLTEIDGSHYLAVAATTGMWMYEWTNDITAGQWHNLADNLFRRNHDRVPEAVAYGSELTAWSIHLTKRGTLYVAMERIGGSFPSGVYRIYQAHLLTEAPWTWTGDGDSAEPHAETLWDIGIGDGALSDSGLVYLTVVDGAGEDPDILYLGDRGGGYGLFRGEQPPDFMDNQGPYLCSWTAPVTYTDFYTLYPEYFDEGWMDWNSVKVLFHPVVMPGSSPPKLAIQFSGRMHVSIDGGFTWDQRYSLEHEDIENAWKSKGYNENCPVASTFLADGRPIFSTGDTGVLVATDEEGTFYKKVNPGILGTAISDDDFIPNAQSDHVHALSEWEEDTEEEKRDALFINFSGMVAKGGHGKLFMHLYDREEGPVSHDYDPVNPDETGGWFNITKSLDNLDRYLFSDFVFLDHRNCLLGYTRYTGPIGESNSVPEQCGVLKGTFAGWKLVDDFGIYRPIWYWEEWSNGLPAEGDRSNWVTQLLYNSYRGERIFLTISRGLSMGGGLYVAEEPDFDTWVPVYDGDFMDGDGDDCLEGDPDCCPEDGSLCADNDSDQFRDFRSMAQSSDGSWLYAGTRGISSGLGGLLLCTDPSHATDKRKWEILANDPEDDDSRVFRFYESLPFWSADWLYGQEGYIDKKMTWVSSLAVDPGNREVVYVGLTGRGMSKREGLWHYDGDEWGHISADQIFEGIDILSLNFSPIVPDQLLVGTNGQGLYIRTLEETSEQEQ